METYKILDRNYPVVALRLMEDAEWSRLTQENAVHNFTRVFGHPPETVAEAVEWQREEAAEAVRRLEGRRGR